MTHEDFIIQVAGQLGWTEERTSDIVGTIIDVVSTELKVNSPIVLDYLGTLKTDIQSEYILVNPETKERHLMPPSIEVIFEPLLLENGESLLQHVGFTPDEVLYNELNSAFSHFEPTPLNEGVEFSGIPEIVDAEQEEEIVEQFEEEILEEAAQAKPLPEVEVPFLPDEYEEKKPISQTQSVAVELTPPRLRPRMENKIKTPSVWIPIAGGVAIVVAALFFFKGDENR